MLIRYPLMNKFISSLIFLLFLAVFFRFYNLEHRGVFTFDEGSFLLESRTMKYSLDWFSNYLLTIPLSSQKALDTENLVKNFSKDISNFTTGRPGHNFLMTISQYFYNDPINAGNFSMAFFGTLSVLLTVILAFLTTRSYLTAFLAGLFLSLLPFHIYYSRSSMSETDAGTFFLLSLICYYFFIKTKSLRYYLIMALLIGIAFIITASRFAFITPIIVDIFLNRSAGLKRLPLFIIVFILPTIFVEAIYHYIFLLTHNLGIIFAYPTYIEQLLWSYIRLSSKANNYSLINLSSYLIMLIQLGGISFLVSSAYGVATGIKSKDKILLPFIFITLLTLGFQSLFFLKAARGISPILPLICIFAGLGIINLARLLKKNSYTKVFSSALIIILLCVFILGEFLSKDFQFFNQSTKMPQTINYLKSNHIQNLVTPSYTLIKGLDPTTKVLNYQNTLAKDKTYKFDVQNIYLLTNYQKYTVENTAYTVTHRLDSTLTLIEKNCQPTFTAYENFSPLTIAMFAYEHNTNMEKTLEFINSYDYYKDSAINIYNLDLCLPLINS
jgi:hypothetical protein